MKNGILYKVRNHRGKVIDTLSEKHLLRRISSGKFSGDEEISAPPYVKWHKFSSHPIFFDAFMKRLYSKKYKSAKDEKGRDSDIQSVSASDMATRKGRVLTGFEPDDPSDKTHRVGGEAPGEKDSDPNYDEEKNFGGTVLQSDIEELFADVNGSDSEEQEENVYEATEKGTDLVLMGPEPTEDHPLPQTGMMVDEPPGAVAPMPPKKEAKPKKSNRLMIYGIIALLLVALLQLSGGDKPSTQGGLTPNTDAGSISELLVPVGDEKSRIAALLLEGRSLKKNDTPLFYRGALEAFKEAMRIDDTNPKILAEVAETSARVLPLSPSPKAAIGEIRRLIKKGRRGDPHYSGFYRAEALVALATGKLDIAIDAVAAALESDPSNPGNLVLAAEIQFARGETQEAGQNLVEALKVDPDNTVSRYLYAQVALSLGDLETARTEGLEALRLNPLHPPTYLLLAEVASEQNRIEEAIGLYETCGRLARFTVPNVVARAYFRLGQLQESSGDSSAAKNAYRLAYYYDSDLEGVRAKAASLNTSSSSLRELAEIEEYDSEYFIQQGDQLVEQKKLNEAIRFFQAAYLINPKNAKNIIKLGDITEKTASSYEDFKRVMGLYQRAIERKPQDPEGFLKLGMLETEQYNLDRGLVLLRQAESLSPDDAKVFVALGKHFFKRRDYNVSLNYFLGAAKINPTDSETLYYAGLLRLLFKKDSAKDAIRFFYQSYSVDPENYDAMVEWLKLKVLGYQKNFAIKFVRNLLSTDPQNANYYWALGEIYSSNKEFRRSISNYHKALDLDNRSSKFRMSLAAALEALGDLPKATAEYRLASLLDRRNSDGFYRASDLLFRMNDFKGAEKVLNYLVSVTPNYPGSHRYLSKIYEKQRKKELAIKEMEREVSTNPDNFKFVIELAQLYMKYKMYKKAINQLQRVANLPSLTKAPEFVYDKIRSYLLLSRCYRQENRAESAEAAIKLAMEIDASDPELHRELGYVYYALQRDKEGVKEFEFYLRRKPAAQDASKIKSLIKKMRIDK